MFMFCLRLCHYGFICRGFTPYVEWLTFIEHWWSIIIFDTYMFKYFTVFLFIPLIPPTKKKEMKYNRNIDAACVCQ